MKKLGGKIKENTDNNNVVLRGINETLNKLEDKIDEKSGIVKDEVKIEAEKQTFYDKFIKTFFNANEEMFDEQHHCSRRNEKESGKAGFDKALKSKVLLQGQMVLKKSDKYK